MKDVSATLRRLDEEIVGHHQRIAYHQVEIMRLQDTRKVLMRLVEDDISAAEHAKHESAGMISGQHAQPVLIVRKVGTGDEDGSASKAAKAGTTMHAKTEPAKKQGTRRTKSASGDFRTKILGLIDTETPMTSQEIGDHLGLARDDKVRKPMSNALYQLRIKGALVRDDQQRYSLKVDNTQ